MGQQFSRYIKVAFDGMPGHVAQSVTCLATDACLTADPGGREFDPGPVPYFRGDWSWNDFYGHSPPSADSFKKGCCQLQAKVCAQITG